MARVILILILISTSSTLAMTLRGAGQVFELEKNKDGYQLSKGCTNCEALKIISNLNREKIEALLKKEKDQRVAPGTRLCSALGAMVWVLEDEKKGEWSICQFKDKSAILTDDLGRLIQEKN